MVLTGRSGSCSEFHKYEEKESKKFVDPTYFSVVIVRIFFFHLSTKIYNNARVMLNVL